MKIDSFLLTIQLVLGYRSLILFPRIHATYGFPVSQHVVYAHPKAQPMFLDENMRKVNVEYLLHIVNFFKYHMTREEEATLYPFLCNLEDSEKPRRWEGRLTQGVKQIGSSWKGSYGKHIPLSQTSIPRASLTQSCTKAYLHNNKDMRRIRSHIPCDSIIYSDTLDLDNGFQTLEFDFSPPKQLPWPAAFERHLTSLPSPSLIRALKSPQVTGCTTFPQTKATPEPNPEKEVQGSHTTSLYYRTDSPTNHTYFPPSPPVTLSTTRTPSTTTIPPPLKGTDYIPFTGTGVDAAPFHCIGNIHALPPQHGIPGWQRITMMKSFDAYGPPSTVSKPSTSSTEAFADGDENEPDWHDPDFIAHGGCWAYEGIVLPGGMLMLGRWWSPTDEGEERLCTGPWIFWKVDS